MRVLLLAGALALRLAPEKAAAKPLSKQPWGEKWSLPYRQPMANMQNTQYSAKFDIGEITMKGIFDTGSFELLVLSEKCEHCSVTPYDAEKSPTFKPNGTVVQHVFGSGPCLSMKGYEQVSVGPMSASKMTFYEIVQHNIPVFEGASFSAIVGLGDGPTRRTRASSRSSASMSSRSVWSAQAERMAGSRGAANSPRSRRKPRLSRCRCSANTTGRCI
jgi:hypothetical protein